MLTKKNIYIYVYIHNYIHGTTKKCSPLCHSSPINEIHSHVPPHDPLQQTTEQTELLRARGWLARLLKTLPRPLTLPCQAESRGYYIDAADYRAEPPFAQYILRATPLVSLSAPHPPRNASLHSRYVKYLTEFQRGISNGTIDRSHPALVGHKLRAHIPLFAAASLHFPLTSLLVTKQASCSSFLSAPTPLPDIVNRAQTPFFSWISPWLLPVEIAAILPSSFLLPSFFILLSRNRASCPPLSFFGSRCFFRSRINGESRGMEWNNWEEKLTMERRLDDRGQVARKPSTETGIKDPRYNHCVALMHGNDGKN